NGIQTEIVCLPWDFGIKKIWGSSSSDVYIVGYYGNIAHYDGTNWNRIESGTTLNINDIWGDYNQKTKEWEILAACGNYLHGYENERAIVRILNNNTATLLNATGSKWPLIGVWFKAGKKYYVNGAGIYRTKILGSEWIGAPLEFTEYTTQRIRGNDINDLVASGDFGDLLHFNGYNWQSYISQTYLPNGTLLSVDIKRNVVVATGWISQQAVLIIGQR
ncbi:MAG: glucosyl transferase, partial [Ignavibacteriaceae bacterium]